MPRATKETKKEELKEEKKTAKSKTSTKKTAEQKKKTASTSKVKKAATKKKSTAEVKEKAPAKKVASKKISKTKKETTTSKVKKETKASKTTSSKKVTKKATKEAKTPKEEKKTKASTKKTTTKKADTKKTTSKKIATTTNPKKVETNIVAEYYDLPYRYNETIVKILYQTPTVLFVYWDISDDDRNKFIKEYGEYFFNDTKPILKIYNLTKNYNFEIEINDFANSWYINVNDPNCDYKVELGRKPISFNNNINSDYIYVSSSNNLEFPNDHILLEELPNIVNFKNVKTGKITTKDISTLRLIGINKIYSIYDFYKKLYKDDILDELNNRKILNPSSTSSWAN